MQPCSIHPSSIKEPTEDGLLITFTEPSCWINFLIGFGLNRCNGSITPTVGITPNPDLEAAWAPFNYIYNRNSSNPLYNVFFCRRDSIAGNQYHFNSLIHQKLCYFKGISTYSFSISLHRYSAVSPKYNMSSFGSAALTAFATVSPPIPESKIPIGLCRLCCIYLIKSLNDYLLSIVCNV